MLISIQNDIIFNELYRLLHVLISFTYLVHALERTHENAMTIHVCTEGITFFFSTNDYFKLTTFFDDFVLLNHYVHINRRGSRKFFQGGGPTLSKIDSV